ncbi:MAG: response regulator [Spirochaetes bacterium]|nr:response regulator [Spirochaetota bacterium]
MTSNNPTILIIDEEEMTRFALQKKFLKQGYNVISLDKAEDALYLIKNEEKKIDLLITDVKLRKMDGIELLRYLNTLETSIPVLVLTGQANLEDAIKALRYGAIDFIRKPFDVAEVLSVARNAIRARHEKEIADSVGKYLNYEKRQFIIGNDISACNVLSYKLTKNLPSSDFCNKTTAENLALALREAITNAMFHGNLEISSEIRTEKGINGFNEEIEKRRFEAPYKDRKVTITYEYTGNYVEYIIEDEGPGFDFTQLPDPRNPENFLKDSGRGILIIQIHMDEVSWNEKGNIIKMKKYRTSRKESENGGNNVPQH